MNTKKIIYFGEKVKGYDVRVLNEREVRAGEGLLFLFAIISFLNSYLLGNFYYTKIFVTIFLLDFIIRIFINPKFSPSLIIGKFITKKQKPEYVGASQKKFAWAIGLVLSTSMFYLIVLNNIIGPINIIICLICLVLLFFEGAFGICIGCFIYNLINKEKVKLCPGNSCQINKLDNIQKIGLIQILILILFIFTIFFTSQMIFDQHQESTEYLGGNQLDFNNNNTKNDKNCIAPDWAIAIGHEEKWKLHNGCR